MKVKLTSDRFVGQGEEPYIIAELGSNHNGDMELARKLIDAASRAGADCVKFQSWSKDTIFSKVQYEANYFLTDDYRNRDDYTMEEIVDKFAISELELLEMRDYCLEVGIDFTSTPFSNREVDFLVDDLNAPFVKVASMDLNNYQFLEYIAKKGVPIVLSLGLSSLSEIDRAVSTIEAAGNKQIVLLHCVAIYPPADEQMNLKNIDSLAMIYPYHIGFSDHTLGTCIPLAAVSRGASLIEKHFTLDKEMFGWDHKVSADEEDMSTLVRDSRRIFDSLGTGRIQQIENDERVTAFRRSIVSTRQIKKGETVLPEMIDFKRPGSGLPPEAIKYVLGKVIKKDIGADELIDLDDF